MEQRRSQPRAEARSEEGREVLCERCRSAVAWETESLPDGRGLLRKAGEIAVSHSTMDEKQLREIRRDLKNLKYKKKIREQDLKARGQFYTVVAISQRDNVSMKEAARIYLESKTKAK